MIIDNTSPAGKVFGIGAGKTGTTSLAGFFQTLGYTVGAQDEGERLLRSWSERDFAPIIALARTADFFQDVPFNCPGTFEALDAAFPGSKFILTVRDSNSWYRSLTTFHTALLGRGWLPTTADLAAFTYRYPGWILEAVHLIYGAPREDPYHRDTLIRAYERYNESVQTYFANRPESLLTVELSDPSAARQVVEFVGRQYRGEPMPHLNQTATIGQAFGLLN